MFSDYPWPLWLCIDVCAFEEVVIFSSVYRLALTGKALYQSTWPGFWAGCLIGICTGACCWSQAGWPGACVSGWVGLLPGHTRMGLNLGLQGGLGAWDCSVRPRSWVHRGQPGKWGYSGLSGTGLGLKPGCRVMGLVQCWVLQLGPQVQVWCCDKVGCLHFTLLTPQQRAFLSTLYCPGLRLGWRR